MIVAVDGAIKNVGDFLIADRSVRLLRAHVTEDIVRLPRIGLDDSALDLMRQARAVVLCGGPAYTARIYPDVYGVDLGAIATPVYPLGQGWGGKPRDIDMFGFTPEATSFVQAVHAKIGYSSVRDPLTQQVLAGIDCESVVTGCPAWYALDDIDKDLQIRTPPRRVVYTAPANTSGDARPILRALSRAFPHAQRYATFHRGILPDRHTPWRAARGYTRQAVQARAQGFAPRDVSYDLRKTDFYRDCDLHVGFRVHAHLQFLSHRIPSILICEDGRGAGQARALGLPVLWADDPDLVTKLTAQIERLYDTQGAELQEAVETMRARYGDMRQYLERIEA